MALQRMPRAQFPDIAFIKQTRRLATLECLAVLGLGLTAINPVHASRDRALMHPVDQRFYSVGGAFKMCLHRAIRQIAHPSGDAQIARGADSPIAVEHALHAAVDDEVV